MTALSSKETMAPRPGRFGEPEMTIANDPRADPRMTAVMEAFGLHQYPEQEPVTPESSLEEILAFCAEAEAGFQALFGALYEGLEPVAGVDHEELVIIGVDNSEVKLFIHRPQGAAGPLPGVLHIHGGGMAILSAADPSYRLWRDELAVTGLVVVGVEYRNSTGALGPHPFPAGLNDCTTALKWVAENSADLGISRLIVSGESGGGNLTLATTLKAKQDGHLDVMDGVYAKCPYISGLYATMPAELPSLTENDGYLLGYNMMAVMARSYSPDGSADTNPLAWPYHAAADDLAGMPPHVISVNELDPLRDEGLAYYRKLLAAGVVAMSRTVNGTCHAGDCIFREALPEVYRATINDISSFAHSL